MEEILGAFIKGENKFFCKFLANTSLIKVDFPLPDTPVTQTNFPKGIVKSTFFKLFSFAPLTTIFCPLPLLLDAGTGIFNSPLKYFPVNEFLLLAIANGVPSAIIFPP
jgi:hypothetical protein